MITYTLGKTHYARLQLTTGQVFHGVGQSRFWAIVSAMAKAYKEGLIK